MKYIIFVTVFLFGSFFVAQKILADNSNIIISEIGAYVTSTHEWVEIWNKGSESIDIKDWKLWENNTNHSLKSVTSSDSIVAPGEYGIIAQSGEVFLKDYPDFTGSVFDSSWNILNESGEEIGLKDDLDNFIEKFTYVSTTKFSLERKDPFLNDYTASNWQENSVGNTIGLINSNNYSGVVVSGTLDVVTTTILLVTTTSNADFPNTTTAANIFDWSFIKINEIVSDPENGNEKVELFNNSSSTLSISGGSICDYTQDNCKILSGEIAGYDWLVADLLTNRYLNNASDTIFLKDNANNIIDEVVFGENIIAPEKGQSLIRKIDGEDSDSDLDWSLTDKITLGVSNELVVNAAVSQVGANGQSVYNYGANSSVAKSVSSTEIKSKVNPKVTKKDESDQVKIIWQLVWPYGLDVGEEGIFNARGTADPRGGDISFFWNFGDNSTGTGHLLGHQYVTSGIYLVSVVASSTSGTFGKKEFKIYVDKTFSVALADIRIIAWQTNNENDLPEYVELENNLNQKQNISGWKIKNKSGKEYDLPENTFLSASGTLKFFRTVTHLSFDKNEDAIRLTSPNDQVVDVISWKIEKEKIKNISKKSSPVGGKVIRQNIKGTVTVEPGVFGSQIFYINDGQSGIQAYQYKKDFPDLKIGDYIQVRGEISQIAGVKRIKIKDKNDIDVLSTGNSISITTLLPQDFSEDALGSIIKISGEVVEVKNNYLYLDDGSSEVLIYFYKSTNINIVDFKEGDKISVVGLLDKNKDGWRILPRYSSDIQITYSSQNKILSSDQTDSPDTRNDTVDRYLTATAGGLTTLLFGLLARARGAMIVGGAKKVISLAARAIRRG